MNMHLYKYIGLFFGGAFLVLLSVMCKDEKSTEAEEASASVEIASKDSPVAPEESVETEEPLLSDDEQRALSDEAAFEAEDQITKETFSKELLALKKEIEADE